MSRRGWVPGGGFVLLIASWGGLAWFAAWGLQEPDLDRVWWILEQADLGTAHVTWEDAELLERCIARNPEIALDRLGGKPVKLLERTSGGWTTGPVSYFFVAPTGGAGLRLDVECRGAARYPARVLVEVGELRGSLVFTGDGRESWVLPASAGAFAAARPALGRLVADTGFGCAAGADCPGVGLRLAGEPL